MSTLSVFELYDFALLVRLVRAFRAARGDREALAKLVTEAQEPRLPKARDAYLRKALARLRELSTPDPLVENARRAIEPRALLLERLAKMQSFDEWEIYPLAARDERAIPNSYTTIEWLVDDDARRRGPTPEMTVGWIAGFCATTPRAREALFGGGPLMVDGIPTIGQDRAWVLDTTAVGATRQLLEELVRKPPPPLDEYRVWYPHLNAMSFTMDESRAVPNDGRLAWEYAHTLTTAARAIASLIAMLRTCEQKKLCVQVVYE